MCDEQLLFVLCSIFSFYLFFFFFFFFFSLLDLKASLEGTLWPTCGGLFPWHFTTPTVGGKSLLKSSPLDGHHANPLLWMGILHFLCLKCFKSSSSAQWKTMIIQLGQMETQDVLKQMNKAKEWLESWIHPEFRLARVSLSTALWQRCLVAEKCDGPWGNLVLSSWPWQRLWAWMTHFTLLLPFPFSA